MPRSETRGPIVCANSSTASFVPLQGCTVNCNAVVPAGGQAGAAISFQGSATSSGCAGQPVYSWNFGDGTPFSSQQNPTHAYATAGTYTWTLTSSAATGVTMIDTVVGGVGDGNPATQAPLGTPIAIARDPQGQGIYIADNIGGTQLIRFVNTGSSAVTVAGLIVPAGAIRAIAGSGLDPTGENIPALQVDLGAIGGLAVSPNGNLVYFINQIDALVRAVNVSGSTLTVGSISVAPGRVGTLGSNFPNASALNGLAVHPVSGEVYLANAAPGINRVVKIAANGTQTNVAGNGASTKAEDTFTPGAANTTPLLQPRAVEFDGSNNLLIADTGHGRVIRVDAGGNASLVYQYPGIQQNSNPIFPSGLTVQGGNVYTANGNQQTVTRVTGLGIVAGSPGNICDYTISNCGDGGAGSNSSLYLVGATGSPPLAGLESDGSGLYIADQGPIGRGRVRYLNLTGGSVTIGGVTIPPGAIDTIVGNGRISPYDGGLATSAAISPSAVGVAIDPNGNLWVADTIRASLRFVNRGVSSIRIFSNTLSEQVVPPGSIVTVNRDVGIGPTDGVPVIQAGFDSPQGLFVTNQGVYVADSKGGPTVPPQTINNRDTSLIRFINTTASNVTLFPGSTSPIVVAPGHIAKIAGGGEFTVNGDGGFALGAKFIGASDLVVKADGTIYVADVGQKAVRKIEGNTGIVSSLTNLSQAQYTGLGLDSTGRLYVANYDGNTVLREVGPGAGAFSTFSSNLIKPRDVTIASDGTAYVTVAPPFPDPGNHQIIKISSAGGAGSVVAGSGQGFFGDGGPAANALLNIAPYNLSVGSGSTNQLPMTVNIVTGPNDEVFFADSFNNRVRRLSQSVVTCVKTGTITIAGDNPVPQLTSISPNSALQGSGALTLTVNGNGFVPSSKVRWNGQERATTYMSSMQLTAVIPASDLTSAGVVTITVFNPTPGGGNSNGVSFTVSAPNPVPAITGISPSTAVEGSPEFILTVNGAGFVQGSIVRWDGQNRVTSYQSGSQLRAQILVTDLVGIGTASVTVFNPAPGGGLSNIFGFTITTGTNPVPILNSISPNSAAAGGPGLTLTANGSNFTASSKVRWNGMDRDTVVISSTQLQATILGSDIATSGAAQVTVFTPTPGGGVTSAVTFTVGVPALASVSAASYLGGSIAAESIVAAFGVGLATGVQVADSLPLPTNLLGTEVKVKDSLGGERNASLFFVAPEQINYFVPSGTAEGTTEVRVLKNGQLVGLGQMQVTRVAPGMFAANVNGRGVAAADALRVVGGVQTYEAIALYDGSQFVPIPVDLEPSGHDVYLILYGTGFRSNNGLGGITVTVGGENVGVLYAGAQGKYVGLDQLNIGPIPRSLIGRGLVDIVLRVEGGVSNVVQVMVK